MFTPGLTVAGRHLPPPLVGTLRRVRRAVHRTHVALGRPRPDHAELTALVQACTETAVPIEVERRLAEIRSQQTQRADRDFTLDLIVGTGHHLDRVVTEPRYRALLAEAATLTGASERPARDLRAPDLHWAGRSAYRALHDAESRGLGRIAGSTYNILGKLIIPPLLAPPAGALLEIGSLYGLFSPMLLRQFAQTGVRRPLTVLDPFAGLQLQPGTTQRVDPSGTPVTEATARTNLDTFGAAADDTWVINGFSSDDEARRLVAARRYAVVVIDGDHSEAGVYADLWWVQTLVVPGAVVVMDDFGDARWPGVERAARRYLADGGRLELLGTASTSAYLRAPEQA